jgi:hypothetical protein
VNILIKRLQKEYGKLSDKSEYDFTGISIPDELTFEKGPIPILIDGNVFFIYKKPEWYIIIGRGNSKQVDENVKWAETAVGSRTFEKDHFNDATIGIPPRIRNEIEKMILDNKSKYLKYIEDVKSKDLKNRFGE